MTRPSGQRDDRASPKGGIGGGSRLQGPRRANTVLDVLPGGQQDRLTLGRHQGHPRKSDEKGQAPKASFRFPTPFLTLVSLF